MWDAWVEVESECQDGGDVGYRYGWVRRQMCGDRGEGVVAAGFRVERVWVVGVDVSEEFTVEDEDAGVGRRHVEG